MFGSMYLRIASTVIAALLVAVASVAHAGTPMVFIFGSPITSTFSAPAVSQPGTTRAVTLNLNQNGNTAYGASLVSLGVAGADAADFAIVPGGSCVPGTTFIYPAGATCTVNLKYTPSRAGNENAFLTASCTSIVGAIGGYTLMCNSTVGNVAVLVGNLFASAVPALSPGMLTALAATLLALASFAALRRNASAPRRR